MTLVTLCGTAVVPGGAGIPPKRWCRPLVVPTLRWLVAPSRTNTPGSATSGLYHTITVICCCFHSHAGLGHLVASRRSAACGHSPGGADAQSDAGLHLMRQPLPSQQGEPMQPLPHVVPGHVAALASSRHQRHVLVSCAGTTCHQGVCSISKSTRSHWQSSPTACTRQQHLGQSLYTDSSETLVGTLALHPGLMSRCWVPLGLSMPSSHHRQVMQDATGKLRSPS
jgi:hypothetical protein